jgi:hypothetical protein
MSKKKRTQKKSGNILIPNNHPNPPSHIEMDIAMILSNHYQTDVEFIIPIDDYKRKSADIIMFSVEWEIKCPHGNSKSTIGNQLRWASKQSKNVILDTRHTKLSYDDIEKRVRLEISSKSSIRKVILINKFGKIVEVQK